MILTLQPPSEWATVSSKTRPRVVIIGGGIAGLAAAYRLSQRAPATEIMLVERDHRLGGKILTERMDGFLIEGGPEAFVVAKPRGIELCRELGLGDHLLGTTEATRRTYVFHHGRLHALPDGMTTLLPRRFGPIAMTRLVSPLGKLRMGLDYFVPPRTEGGDESVAGFVERRLGEEAYDRLVDPLLSGIYGGDGHQLSLAATFPQWRQAEVEHGGLMRAALAARRAMPEPSPGEPRPSPFLAPRLGLATLVTAIVDRLAGAGVCIRTGVAVKSITGATAGGYELADAVGERIQADAVICAVPAPVAADLLTSFALDVAVALRGIRHASIATVSLAYRERDVPRALDGHGYVTGRSERRSVFACTWVSAKWADRAPAGHALFRLAVGGIGRDAVLDGDDESLATIARAELAAVLSIREAPVLTRVVRWPGATPQYAPGHLDRIAAMEASLAARHPGLALAGNSYRGVGLADCILSGERAAETIRAVILGGSAQATA